MNDWFDVAMSDAGTFSKALVSWSCCLAMSDAGTSFNVLVGWVVMLGCAFHRELSDVRLFVIDRPSSLMLLASAAVPPTVSSVDDFWGTSNGIVIVGSKVLVGWSVMLVRAFNRESSNVLLAGISSGAFSSTCAA